MVLIVVKSQVLAWNQKLPMLPVDKIFPQEVHLWDVTDVQLYFVIASHLGQMFRCPFNYTRSNVYPF